MSALGKIGVAAGLFAAYTALPAVIGGTAYHFALKRNGLQTSAHVFGAVNRIKKRGKPEHSGKTAAGREMHHDAVMWFIRSDRENVFLESDADGKKIHAYVLRHPKKTDKWLIALHALTGQPFEASLVAREFYDRGYNIITPSLRGHGLSSDDRVSMGYMDAKDVRQWTEYILKECPEAKIALHGMSLGAAAVMLATGEGLPDNVRCVIEDCGFARCNEQFVGAAAEYVGKSAKTFGVLMNAFMKFVREYDLTDINPINCVRKSTIPMMFIHGEDDKVVPPENCRELYDACPAPKEILLIPGAGHMAAGVRAHDEYYEKVFEFVGKYVG